MVFAEYKQETPSGAGSLFAIFLISFSIINNYEKLTILIISFLTLIYLVDDIRKINFLIRIFIQIFSGFIIVFFNYELIASINLIFLFFLGMLFSFVTTNLFNFNDGANLHISTLFIIILASLIYFGEVNNELINHIIFIFMTFIMIFMFFNHLNLLFFGDSGCFLFSNIILLFLVLNQSTYNIYLFLSIISFSVVDAIYVFLFRLKNQENLLTRNFHHLYQKLEIKFKNYTYLLPSLLSSISSMLLFVSIPNLITLIIIYLLNVFIYLIIRKKLIVN